MSVFPKEIIIPVQAEATSGKFTTVGTITVIADALVLNEKVTIQVTRDGTTFQDLIFNGVIQTLESKHNQITLSGPGQYRVVKTVTAAAVGVSLWKTEAT